MRESVFTMLTLAWPPGDCSFYQFHNARRRCVNIMALGNLQARSLSHAQTALCIIKQKYDAFSHCRDIHIRHGKAAVLLDELGHSASTLETKNWLPQRRHLQARERVRILP